MSALTHCVLIKVNCRGGGLPCRIYRGYQKEQLIRSRFDRVYALCAHLWTSYYARAAGPLHPGHIDFVRAVGIEHISFTPSLFSPKGSYSSVEFSSGKIDSFDFNHSHQRGKWLGSTPAVLFLFSSSRLALIFNKKA